MTHHIKAMSISLAMVGLLWPMTAQPQTNNDYAAIPPFVSSVSTPNVLIILDNSGSMGRRANCDFGSGAGPGGYDTCPTFDETKTYGGLFDPSKCYLYDGPPNVSPDLRFEPNSTKATMATKCANNTEWDGNFLNWVTLRRLDMAKAALIGGVCSVARNASGDCPTTGTPPMVTIKGLDNKAMPSGAQISTSPVPVGGGSNQTRGRLPQSLETSAGANLRFHLGGTTGSGPWPLMGQFCVDDDATLPAANALNCTDGDLYNETGYRIQVALPAQPLGVIQTTGSKVRFGLMEYRGNDGGQVMVPLGSKLYRQLNVSSVSSSNNNTLAMIKGIEDTFNEGNTPMAETFYEATRYIGQMGSSFTTSYVYPIAFSPGVSLAVNGEGGMGLGEVKDLTGTEACPTGMGYVTDACGRDPFFFGSAHSPAWASPSALIPCCQTFIVVFTDGDSQQDQTIPASLTDFAHSVHGVHCTGNDVSSPAAAIDTTCNMHPLTAPKDMIKEHRTDYSNSGSHFLDDVAYWAHISDLRAATVTAQVPGGGPLNTVWTGGQDLPGIQNVTTYTFFAFSQMLNREFLMQTARQGGFEDKNANLIPDNGLTPAAACDDVDLTKPCEYDAVDNLTGAAGRDGTPDTFFESSDVVFMKTKLTDVINHILSKTSSGSSLSVLASSATGEGALYQSYFFPKLQDPVLNTTINWLGFTHGLFIDTFGNIREDTDQNARLWYKNDKIIKTRFDATLNKLLIDRYDDDDMNGLPDDKNGDLVINQLDCNPCSQDLSTLKPIWEGGNRLAQQTAADRKILTWLDNSGGTDNKIVDSGEVIDFTTANCASLKEFLRKVGDLCGVGSPAYNIIDFIRGNQPAGTRDRIRKVGGVDKVWKFGDTIHSTPTEAGPPRERYDVIYGDAGYVDYYRHWRDRRRVVYVGANDGMLHAFNAGFYNRGDDPSTTSNPLEIEHGWFTTTALSATPATTRGAFLGDELWAFIPQELLPHLEWLTSTSYNHVYYVDLKPKITDARIFTAEAACSANAGDPANTACKHPGGWGTILIGGFRMGGSCGTCASGTGAPPMTIPIGGVNRTFYSAYFVLDITDPENDPKLLWVFSDSGMGLSTSYPSVVRVNPTGIPKSDISQEKWFMVVGSGPNGYNADFSGSAQKPKLYAVNLKNGPVGAGNMQPFPVDRPGTV